MTKVRGFTLIEVVISLSTLLIIGSFFFQGRTNLLRRPQVDLPTLEWYLMLRELENPDHALQVTDINASRRITLETRMPVDVPGSSKNYSLEFTRGSKRLVLSKGRNGFKLTLMHHVKSFHCDVHHNLSVETERGERFTAKLLIPDKGEVTDETAIGNHAAISH